MILMGDGCSEDGHDPVPEYLIHCPFKAVYGVHHEVDGGIKEFLGLFGIKVSDQLSGVLDVGEQDRDLLAFALQGTSRGQNLVGQVMGGIRQRLRFWGPLTFWLNDWRNRRKKMVAAGITKAASRWIDIVTRRAGQLQFDATGITKP
jgi:hypothetical protein